MNITFLCLACFFTGCLVTLIYTWAEEILNRRAERGSDDK